MLLNLNSDAPSSSLRSNQCNHTYLTISLVAGAAIISGVFITLAAYQILPHGVNSISQLGLTGKGIGFFLLEAGSLVFVGSVVFSVQEYLEDTTRAEKTDPTPISEKLMEEKISEFITSIDIHGFNAQKAEEFCTLNSLSDWSSERDGRNLLHYAVEYDVYSPPFKQEKSAFAKWIYPKYPLLSQQADHSGVTPRHYANLNEKNNPDVSLGDWFIIDESSELSDGALEKEIIRFVSSVQMYGFDTEKAENFFKKYPNIFLYSVDEAPRLLHYAIQKNIPGLAKWAYEKSPEAGKTTKLFQGMNVFHYAIFFENLPMLQWLLQKDPTYLTITCPPKPVEDLTTRSPAEFAVFLSKERSKMSAYVWDDKNIIPIINFLNEQEKLRSTQ